MTKWKKIYINLQNIKYETNKEILVAMPHSSNYDGYSFWHPLKLVGHGKHNNCVSVAYNDDFRFKLIKYGKNKIINDEIIDVEEFEEAFECMNNNSSSSSYLIVTEPKKIDHEIKIIEELKNG